MTDKELLELAAKAASLPKHVDGMGVEVAHHPTWNPLTDDGDALRLAVKLQLSITFMTNLVDCGIPICLDNNPYAATRRAIVRAAAEIGKV